MRIQLNRLAELFASDLQTAITALVAVLPENKSTKDQEVVETTIWLLESELLNRGILPDNVK